MLCTKDAEVIQALSPESVVLNEYPSLKEVLGRPVLLGKQRPAVLPLAAVAQRRRALGSRQAAGWKVVLPCGAAPAPFVVVSYGKPPRANRSAAHLSLTRHHCASQPAVRGAGCGTVPAPPRAGSDTCRRAAVPVAAAAPGAAAAAGSQGRRGARVRPGPTERGGVEVYPRPSVASLSQR